MVSSEDRFCFQVEVLTLLCSYLKAARGDGAQKETGPADQQAGVAPNHAIVLQAGRGGRGGGGGHVPGCVCTSVCSTEGGG